MKILYITTIGSTMDFFEHLIPKMISAGHTVDIACNTHLAPVSDCFSQLGCKIFSLDCTRTPFNKGNITALKQISKLAENYDIVHCHTPIASACTRIACRKLRKKGLKVFYTAHGFHFFDGAPIKNWLLYYPVEWLCAHWTDVLITMNSEDYRRAQTFAAKKVEYVPGVGIQIERFQNLKADRTKVLAEFGFSPDDFVFINIGELSVRKNQEVAIRALAKLNTPHIKLLIVGKGPLKEKLELLIQELHLEHQVILAGFRNDIPKLLTASDAFVFPSIHEGLPVALMEAMAAGKPVVCSKIRGNVDLIEHEKGGLLAQWDNVDEFADDMKKIILGELIAPETTNQNVVKEHSAKNVNTKMLEIYGF